MGGAGAGGGRTIPGGRGSAAGGGPDIHPGAAAGGGPAIHAGAAAAVLAGLLVVAAILALHSVFRGPLNHDVAWYLHMAEEALSGRRLYVDVVDPNPPPVVFLMMLPALLARVTGIPGPAAARGFVLVLLASSVALSWRLGRSALPGWSGPARGALFVILAGLLVSFPGFEFGQREHLVLASLLPYLFASAGVAATGRSRGRAVPLAAGSLAGVAICLKPHYVAVWFLVEGYLARRRGPRIWLRAENAGVVAAVSGTVAAVLLFAPAYLDIVRWALAAYGDFAPADPSALVRRAGLVLLATLFVVWLLLGAGSESRPRSRAFPVGGDGSPERAPLLVGLLALVASLGAAVIQNKGWAYHWYPAHATALLLVSGAGVASLRGRGLFDGSRRAFAVLSVVALLAGGAAVLDGVRATRAWDRLDADPYLLGPMRRVVEGYAPGGTLYTLTTTMQIAFPLVLYEDVEFASRFNTLWMLPALYRNAQPAPEGGYAYHARPESPSLERYMVDAILTDLACRRPTLLVVDDRPHNLRMVGFRYLEYLGRDPRFRPIAAAYRPVVELGRLQIFRRIAEAPAPPCPSAEAGPLASAGSDEAGAMRRGR